jgi:hypothetical protein
MNLMQNFLGNRLMIFSKNKMAAKSKMATVETESSSISAPRNTIIARLQLILVIEKIYLFHQL